MDRGTVALHQIARLRAEDLRRRAPQRKRRDAGRSELLLRLLGHLKRLLQLRKLRRNELQHLLKLLQLMLLLDCELPQLLQLLRDDLHELLDLLQWLRGLRHEERVDADR